jgi:prepilin-type N-terminal cleavage/methylation domain-containing protein/prepilin-type processing-associated H-X9-DG protein
VPSSCKRAAFTLVELLVVIGIIALLIGILLPALSRAREQAAKTTCMSNMRQVAMAYVGYANENKGWLPASSRGGGPIRAHDWLHYQPGRDIDQSAIGRYLGKIRDDGKLNNDSSKIVSFNINVLRCPSDNLQAKRLRFLAGDPNADYPYSYVQNHYIGAGYVFESGDPLTNASKREAAGKITQVRRASEKLLIYEEADATIDDGHASPDIGTGYVNLLAIRHDRRRLNVEPTGTFTVADRTVLKNVWNGDFRGNVGFCDGSVRYISRLDMHQPSVILPKR